MARPLFSNLQKKKLEAEKLSAEKAYEEYNINNTEEMEDMIRCNSFVIKSQKPQPKPTKSRQEIGQRSNIKKDTGVDSQSIELSEKKFPVLTMEIGQKAS